MEVLHHGISLKVTDSSSKHVPTSNLGIKAAGPKAQATHDEHRRAILKKYPKLGTHATNASQRKEMLRNDPKMKEFNQKNPGSFKRKKWPKNLFFVALTDFGPDLDHIRTAYPGRTVKNSLPIIIDGLPQLYI